MWKADLVKQLPKTIIMTSQYDGLREEQDKLIEKLREHGRIVDVADVGAASHGYHLDFDSERSMLAEFETVRLWNRVVNEACKKPKQAHS